MSMTVGSTTSQAWNPRECWSHLVDLQMQTQIASHIDILQLFILYRLVSETPIFTSAGNRRGRRTNTIGPHIMQQAVEGPHLCTSTRVVLLLCITLQTIQEEWAGQTEAFPDSSDNNNPVCSSCRSVIFHATTNYGSKE